MEVMLYWCLSCYNKDFGNMSNFENLGNTCDGNDLSSSSGSIYRDTNNRNNFWYMRLIEYFCNSSNSSNRTNIESTSETIVRVGMLSETEVGMKVKSSCSYHFGEQHVP